MADRGERDLSASPQRGGVLIGRQPSTSTWVLWVLLVITVAFTAAFATGPFLTTTAAVQPAQVPAGRAMRTTVEEGASQTFVECPGSLWSSRGHDLLCRGPARNQLMTQLIGLVLFVAGDAVLVALIRTRRRRRVALASPDQPEPS